MSKMYSIEIASDGMPFQSSAKQKERAGESPQRWMEEKSTSQRADNGGLNANQLTSLSAMIAYTANKSGQTEYRVERALADFFHVPNAKFLPANDFDSAIRYLADIIPL
jgi:hypothetical protein